MCLYLLWRNTFKPNYEFGIIFVPQICGKTQNSVGVDSISTQLIRLIGAQKRTQKIAADESPVPNRVADFSAYILFFVKKNLFS